MTIATLHYGDESFPLNLAGELPDGRKVSGAWHWQKIGSYTTGGLLPWVALLAKPRTEADWRAANMNVAFVGEERHAKHPDHWIEVHTAHRPLRSPDGFEIEYNRDGRPYKVWCGTHYDIDTPASVIYALESARRRNVRIRVFYGDAATGRDWHEEFETMGTVGRSCGTIKIPLLLKNSRSMGSSGLLDDCIVKIVETRSKRVLYEHPTYYAGDWSVRPITPEEKVGSARLVEEGYHWTATCNGEMSANFRAEEQARRYVRFMLGERMSK